jgi:hypothetical protein
MNSNWIHTSTPSYREIAKKALEQAKLNDEKKNTPEEIAVIQKKNFLYLLIYTKQQI